MRLEGEISGWGLHQDANRVGRCEQKSCDLVSLLRWLPSSIPIFNMSSTALAGLRAGHLTSTAATAGCSCWCLHGFERAGLPRNTRERRSCESPELWLRRSGDTVAGSGSCVQEAVASWRLRKISGRFCSLDHGGFHGSLPYQCAYSLQVPFGSLRRRPQALCALNPGNKAFVDFWLRWVSFSPVSLKYSWKTQAKSVQDMERWLILVSQGLDLGCQQAPDSDTTWCRCKSCLMVLRRKESHSALALYLHHVQVLREK